MNTEELKRLAGAANGGPWKVGKYLGQTNDERCVNYDAGDKGRGIDVIQSMCGISNAKYIAAANPAAVLELIRQLEHHKSDSEVNIRLLAEARKNDAHCMAWLADCRIAVDDNGKRMLPEFVEYLKALKQQRDELVASLKEARELVEDWGAYAPAYMQEKHDLQGDLDKLDASIANAIANAEKQS